ncbi:hypothetical protein [Vibrio lentus]|uniref:Uncharacterized protein n=2 Tax=Vibrio lentus TaxID=136468 RepID=A0A2N7IGU9_9VIBR|nr:hypothetical protein [Vibrio lentus]PML56566.1 hypothetical protein BCT74_20820 [Vibrio lentus]
MDKALSSSEIEERLKHDFKKEQPVTAFELPFTATSIIVPKTEQYASHILLLDDVNTPDKVIIYKAMIAVYNYVFFDKSAAVTAKDVFSSAAKPFISWLNSYKINNRYEILKRYESDRMDELDNHGGYSPLRALNCIIGYAIESEALSKELSSEDYTFLIELRKTKPAPNLNKSQKSIASYFGALDWLRREDIGIGAELYSALASPKLAINSLSLTAATLIIELKEYKNELQTLIKSTEPQLAPLLDLNFKTLSRSKKKCLIGEVVYLIVCAYHRLDKPSYTLQSALGVLLLSNASSQSSYFNLLNVLKSQTECDSLFLNKKFNTDKVNAEYCRDNFTAMRDGNLFSIDVVKNLLRNEVSKAVTKIEEVMFAWLMAGLTVQPTDIPKLTNSDFRLMKVGGRVTRIECEYFKGRSKLFHATRSLSTRTREGKALLVVMEQQEESLPFYTKVDLFISNGINSLLGTLNLLLQSSSISMVLKTVHSKRNIPCLMPLTLCSLISNGIHTSNCVAGANKVVLEDRQKLVRQSQSPCQLNLFGFQLIKNSAVHAFSDPYTLEYLINRNSHSNQTEKVNYLTEDNEAWINNSGRITREVMFDLIQNVFNLGFDRDDAEQLKRFNSEFMAVTESISYRREEMNSRLRMITGQEKGKVNEVGVLSLNDKNESESLSPIYVVDSSITVLKMYNYLHEFKKNYKKILANNSDFLFKTVIPTVEWIEGTLKKMSKQSLRKGRDQFDLMIKNGVVISVFNSM